MTGRVMIEFEGLPYEPFEPGRTWSSQWAKWSEDEAAHHRRIVEHGTFFDPEFNELPESKAKLIRASILGTYSVRPRAIDPSELPLGRDLIPGLWRWGTTPMLGGPPKVGKSHFIAELAAALIIPGRRFMGAFEPAELTEEERARDIWLINAEMPIGDMHEALLKAGLIFDRGEGVPYYSFPGGGALIVEHLEALGGASTFDLTYAENRDWWEYQFMQCPCTGINDSEPPLAVIADNATAILGSDTSRYGAWFAPFRDLLRALDVPNGLAVGHNGLAGKHLMNGVESMAGPDGLWTYTSSNPDDPRSPRYFLTQPRLGGPAVPKARVTVGDDGRLLYNGRSSRDGDADIGEVNVPSWEEEVLERLGEAGAAGLLTTEVTGRGRFGQLRKKALDDLSRSGRVKGVSEGQGIRWHLSDTA